MDNQNYVMPVKAIKNIIRKELQRHKDGFYNAYPSFIMSDVQKEMVSIAHDNLTRLLESCNDYESLDGFLSSAGYRMSLAEWIDSL